MDLVPHPAGDGGIGKILINKLFHKQMSTEKVFNSNK